MFQANEVYSEDLTIVINETDNIFVKFANLNIDVTTVKNQLSIIGAKANNNKIGYMRVKTNAGIVKVIICPKIFAYDTAKFLEFLKESLRVIAKYRNKAGLFRIDDSLLNLALLNQSYETKHSFDAMLELKFLAALNEIASFFRKFSTLRKRKSPYISNSVEFEIEIGSSVVDPNKSNIHQLKRNDRFDVRLAGIAQAVISTFLKHNKLFLSDRTIGIARGLQSQIKRKFNTTGFGAKSDDVTLTRNKGLFKSHSTRNLQNNLLALLSSEDFFDTRVGETTNSQYLSTSSFFFEANIFFEYLVYDQLLSDFDEKDIVIKPTAYQDLFSCCNMQMDSFKVTPEFLLKSIGCVVDVKWKILSELGASFNYDVLKLKRDAELHLVQNAMLIYPHVANNILNKAPYKLGGGDNINIHIKETPPL
ncbi:5-methylcytosine restriction system specificity protein McrC [Paraglaciecola chathamensis]|uniref:Uncharacterized protein n=1 Tax=Paraglaciecola chathamensis S18K6 TaxID=1127672 RepID=A0AAV3V5B9_9ALTE|nr:hypothetical protein [Paraglaciecola chathamensis]GAC11823.1 hypothetical protein GCHA_3893 [Paraglaciecola chathamensis S18K6]